MIAEWTREAMAAHLAALGLRRGMDVVVHARLLSFGRIIGRAQAVYDALRDVIGDQATVAAPTYTFQLGPADVYDPAATPSDKLGPFSELVRTLPGAVRGQCPIHNHAAIGPRAAVLLQAPGTTSLGPDSEFQALGRAGFTLVLLGCTFSEGATHLHHMEAVVGVPYRTWLDLPRRRRRDAAVEDLVVRYYGRTEGAPRDLAFEAVLPGLAAAGALHRAPAPYGESFATPLAALEQVGAELLRRDPFALVRQ